MDWDEKGYAKKVCSNQLQENHAIETPKAVPGKFDYGRVLQGGEDGPSEGQH